MRDLLKRIISRALRPGLQETHQRIELIHADSRALADRMDRIHGDLADLAASTRAFQDHAQGLLARVERRLVSGAVWRGGLDGSAADESGHPVPDMTEKFRSELAFWKSLVHRDSVATWGLPFEEVYGGWQKIRLSELAEFLGIVGSATALEALASWAAPRRAVEIGSGPFPSISLVRWEQAVAIDPLAEGFLAENLIPRSCVDSGVVFLATSGEFLPLPSGVADLVVLENCLDHVDEPRRVLRECARVLKPAGNLWLLVDLMDYRDHMHPHPFSEAAVKELLSSSGFETVRDRTSDHKSHPNAYGEYRVLARTAGPTA